MNPEQQPESGQLVLYKTDDGNVSVQVTYRDGDMWLTQADMADLFQVDRTSIGKHIRNILNSGEVEEKSNVQFLHIANSDKPVAHYGLDMIISVGYRVNSLRGTQFRKWATSRINEYVSKGFVINDDAFEDPANKHFDELVARVRKIRTSEAQFHRKVTDIFATSVDYDPNTEIARTFFAIVQNKLHFAIHGHTAAEVIVERVDASKPTMGLTSWKGNSICRPDAIVAKNYLEPMELTRLELLVEQFLTFAMLRYTDKRDTTMAWWLQKLDEFLKLNDMYILDNAGTVSNDDMKRKVDEELAKFNKSLKGTSKPGKQKKLPNV